MFRRLRIAEVASMIWEPGNDVATITDPRPDLLLRNEEGSFYQTVKSSVSSRVSHPS